MKNYCIPLSHQIYTAAEVREFDRIAIEEQGITGLMLMTRAGQFTFESIRQSFPNAKSMLVFCGIGNNAGDGFVIARLGRELGMSVRVVQVGKSDLLKSDADLARQAYLSHGGVCEDFDQINADYTADIVVDALFGTGLSRGVTGVWQQAIEVINHSNATVVAVDIPSGLEADTGRVMGCAVQADLTTTYIARKRGMYTGQARGYVGKLLFSDLDIPQQVIQPAASKVSTSFLLDESIPRLPQRQRSSHKGMHGHVLVIGGAAGMSGAVRMAAEAALVVGAGLVTVATHPEHAAWLNATRPELMVKAVNSAQELTPYLKRADVIAIGPGLGTDKWGQSLFFACLATAHDKIIDADALNLLSNLATKRDNWILTPHSGEASRLLGESVAAVEADRFAAAAKIQANFSGVCVLKGAGTIISAQEKALVSALGNPGMAVGGMGDVLTGVIASLVAQGLTLENAASAGVMLHAKAADLAAKAKGERGLMATELYPYLRELVN